MALMTEERRKEMEEEMSRFELEIAGPEESKTPSSHSASNSKPLSPPPAPPAVAVLIPEVLIKAPPPPPPPLSPPSAPTLRPPPPPPILQGQPDVAPASIRFIPHQLQRQPAKPPMRPNFMPMHGHPGSFPPPGPFGPPLGQGPPMGPMHGSMPPGNQMHPVQMPPGHHMGHMHGPMPPMPPGVMPMHMPHQMGNMGMNLSMPPGFCPPSGPPMHLQTEPREQQYFNANTAQNEEVEVSVSDSPSPTSGSSSVLAAAPAIYAAPFIKSLCETVFSNTTSANGQDTQVVSSVTSISNFHRTEKSTSRNEETSVGPTVPTSTEENVVSRRKEKKKKIVRMAGGQAWEDNSLLDWESDDFRIFCGDLGNDVTDEVLIRAFSKYPSFVKAKVIRDKRTNKTKGYGFVSFKDPQDFIKAMREMNGRYVGSRPIKLRKSTWRDRNIDLVKKKQKEKEKLGLL